MILSRDQLDIDNVDIKDQSTRQRLGIMVGEVIDLAGFVRVRKALTA